MLLTTYHGIKQVLNKFFLSMNEVRVTVMQNMGSGRGNVCNGYAPTQGLWPSSLGLLNVLQCSGIRKEIFISNSLEFILRK